MPRNVMRFLEKLTTTTYLRKWLVLGAAIGLVAGIGAIVFIHAVELASRLLLGGLGGYRLPGPLGESVNNPSSGFARPWAVPLVVGLGGFISGVLVFRYAPEAEGHGTDAAIDAVHHNPKGIRGRVSIIKMLASAITIGSGGSGGREGPTAQISAGFGSFLARLLNLTPVDARIAVTVGIGAGIGAIFRAPLGGAVIGAEILYREDIDSEALLPSFIASIIGFSVFGAAEGFTPIFGFLRGYHFTHPVELFYFALLGVAAGLFGRLYSGVFYGTASLFKRLRVAHVIKPALGGLAVGSIGLAFPEALGTGYGYVQKAMTTQVLNVPVWTLLLLPLVKIVATSLSIGSGASAGIFGPGMVIGGLLGAGLWRVGESFAGMPDTPAPFVVVGMIACFGSISHAYLAVMLMVAEMTGTLALLPPAMVALGVAALVVGDRTIYASQLRNRSESVAYRTKLGLPLMSTIPIEKGMSTPRLLAREEWSKADVEAALTRENLSGAPVIDDAGRFIAVATRRLLENDAEDGRDPSYPTVPSSSTLDTALDVLATSGIDWAPVVDHEGRVIGIVAMSDLMRAYQDALASSQRKLRTLLRNAVLLEGEVSEDSSLGRKSVRDAGLPAGTVILTVLRGEQLMFPTGDTRLEAGDLIRVVARREDERTIMQLLSGDDSADDPGVGPSLV